MVHHPVSQKTEEWFKLRAGVVTASELSALLSPLFKPREGDGVDAYLALKLAERWTGGPIHTFGGGAAEQGSLLEEEVLPFLAFTRDLHFAPAGFITTDDESFGCSPDGWDGVEGCEIKSCEAHTHVRHLLKGELPKEYAAQVHGSMAVTGAPRWTFVSYRRGMPALVKVVERDEAICATIIAVVSEFNARLDEAFARVKQMEEA